MRVRALALLAAAGLLACAGGAGPSASGARRGAAADAGTLSSASGPPARVVMVSIAGLTPERYLGRPGEAPAMPTLAALAVAGVAAEDVEPVAPAATYPAHVTLVTGRTPARHGVTSDRWIVERAARAPTDRTGELRATPLWRAAAAARKRSAALGWPGTRGAAIDFLLPELRPGAEGAAWERELRSASSAALVERALALGAGAPEIGSAGPARDALLVRTACDLLEAAAAPALALIHLSQTGPVLRAEGPSALATRESFARADAELARLLDCLRSGSLLDATALVVAGDHGALAIHGAIEPNVALAQAGLLVPAGRPAAGVQSWSAIARSNGGSAFVYAKDEEDAVLARRALEDAARRTRAFRVVSANQLLRVGADPEAWFGLEAEPGYVFLDALDRPLLHAATERGGAGYLPSQAAMSAGFVAFGRGVRRGVRVPRMEQTDVAPTVALLLGLELGEVEGRPLVGAVDLSGAAEAAPGGGAGAR